jgi:repressor LexA
MSYGLTTKQRRLLSFITAYTDAHGTPPSYAEMQQHMGLASKSGVSRLMKSLEARGHLRWIKHHSRSLEVLHRPPAVSAPPPAPAAVPATAVTREFLTTRGELATSLRNVADGLGNLSGLSPCQVTITIREMPFAKEHRA